MEDSSFLKVVTVLLPAVYGLVLLATGARTHSGLDGGLGIVLFIAAASLFGLWFARR